MIFWTPILEYLKIRSLPNSKLSRIFPFLNQSQQERKLIQISGEMYDRSCNLLPELPTLSSVSVQSE